MSLTFEELKDRFKIKRLKHYGVKGMRWGIRKSDDELAAEALVRVANRDGSIDIVSNTTGARTSVKFDPNKVQITSIKDRKIKLTGEQDAVDRLTLGIRDAQKQNELQSNAKPALTPDGPITAIPRSTRGMSDKDLQAVINRLNNEKQFRSLTADIPQAQQSKVKKFAKDLITEVLKDEVRRVSKGAAAIQVEKALVKGGRRDLADRIAPKKKK